MAVQAKKTETPRTRTPTPIRKTVARKRVTLDIPDDLMEMVSVYRQGQTDEAGNTLTQQGAIIKLLRDRLGDIGKGAGQKAGQEAMFDQVRALRADVKGLGGALLLLVATLVDTDAEDALDVGRVAYAREVLTRARGD